MNWFPCNSNLRQERVNLHSHTCYFSHAMREKCPNTEFSLVHILSYSVRIKENRDRKNFIFGPFSCSDKGVNVFISVFRKLIICGTPYVFYKEIIYIVYMCVFRTYKLYILSKRPLILYNIHTLQFHEGQVLFFKIPILYYFLCILQNFQCQCTHISKQL